MEPRVTLLSNRNSGLSSGNSALAGARDRLAERVGRWREVSLREGEDLPTLARDAARDCDVLLVAGGDGTLRAAARGMMRSDVPMAILPFGTVNVLARELGIPLDDPARAVDIALDGLERQIDIGICNGEPFLLVCSGGIDSTTVSQVNEGLKSAMGATAYALAAVGALTSFSPPTVRVVVDGRPLPEIDIFLIAVGNTSLYGGDLKLLPDARVDDGLLDLVIFTAPQLPAGVRNAAFLPQLADAALGRHPESDNIWLYQAENIEIHTDPPMLLQMDGDLAGETPVLLSVAPAALRIMVPAPETPPVL